MNFLNSVEVFLQVVELASFTRAANARNVTPGSISIQISELEKELGVRLFHRSTRKLLVSDEGQVLYERFKRIVQDINETKREFSTPTIPTGRVRILAGSIVVKCLVMPLLREFSQRYPGISLEFLEPGRVFGAKNDERDVILCYGPLGESTLVAKSLGISQLWVAASEDYLARHGEPKDLQDLQHHACLGYIDRGSGRLTDWMFNTRNQPVEVQPSAALSFNNGSTLIDAGVQGLGLVFAPDVFLREPIARGIMKPVLTDHAVTFKGPYVLYHPDHLVPMRVRIFLDFLFEKYSPKRPLMDSLDEYAASLQAGETSLRY